jgi:hypothetical protein
MGGQSVLNFGEHFVELLLPRLGCQPRSFDVAMAAGEIRPGEPCLLMIGSEFHHGLVDGLACSGCHVHVWGQGNGRGADRAVDMRLPKYRDNVTIHALRGPLTKRISHFDGDVPLLDPGFLMPAFYPSWHLVAEESEVLYLPHHANFAKVSKETAKRIGATDCLNVMLHRDEVLDFMARVASAQFVLANTLHGLIFCLAYCVPCALCLTEGEELNMPDKWRDVFESLGRDPATPLPIVHNLDEGERWWETEGRSLVIPDSGPLLRAFPFSTHTPSGEMCEP